MRSNPRPSSILGSELVALTTMLEAKPVHPQTSKMENFPTIVNDFEPLIALLLRFYMPWSLTHLFLMRPFSTSSKHQKTVRFSDIFRGQRKGAWETNGLMSKVVGWRNELILLQWKELSDPRLFLPSSLWKHFKQYIPSRDSVLSTLIENWREWAC